MCFGCSKEPSHRDNSFEYPQHMFWLINRKYNFQFCTLYHEGKTEIKFLNLHFILSIIYAIRNLTPTQLITLIKQGYSNFLNECAIYFIEWSEKYLFHEWWSHEWNIHFPASRDEINSTQKFEFSFYYIQFFKRDRFFALNDVIHVQRLCHINDDVV